MKRTAWYRPDQVPARYGFYERNHRKVSEYTDRADRRIWLDLWVPVRDKRSMCWPGIWYVRGPGDDMNDASHQRLSWRGVLRP